MNKKIFIIGLLILVVLISGCVKEQKISEQNAIDIARNTEEVSSFLNSYGKCEGCNPTYSKDYANLIGCVEYTIKKDSENMYLVEYWVSKACSFRYGVALPQVRIKITIDSITGKILTISPDTKYILNPNYCKKDEDCLCRSGSGVRFLGCGNFFSRPSPGSYDCEMCKCVNESCQTID